jgi:hypothetical protein
MFAHAGAAQGVASTLTLPILENREVVGSVDLHASDPHAFEGHHDELANALGASALGRPCGNLRSTGGPSRPPLAGQDDA